MAKKRTYTREEYSPEERAIMDALYEGHFNSNFTQKSIPFTSKELEENQVLRVKITRIRDNSAIGESVNGQSVSIDILKEEKAIRRLGYPPMDIMEGTEIDVVVFKDRSGIYNGSLAAGYENSLKNELSKSIKDEKRA